MTLSLACAYLIRLKLMFLKVPASYFLDGYSGTLTAEPVVVRLGWKTTMCRLGDIDS